MVQEVQRGGWMEAVVAEEVKLGQEEEEAHRGAEVQQQRARPSRLWQKSEALQTEATLRQLKDLKRAQVFLRSDF